MGISEEIEDAKITAEKNQDLKIEANISKLTKICVIKLNTQGIKLSKLVNTTENMLFLNFGI